MAPPPRDVRAQRVTSEPRACRPRRAGCASLGGALGPARPVQSRRGRRDEQRGRGVHGAEARVRPVLQPLVRREVPQGRQRWRPLRAALQALPAVRAESNQGKGHTH